MKTNAIDSFDNKNHVFAKQVTQKQNGGESAFQFADNRTETIVQRELHEISNNGLKVNQQKISQLFTNHRNQKGESVNRINRHGNSTIIQRKEGDIINGVIRKRASDGKMAIFTDQVSPWYEIPEGSDVNENDKVKFKEGSNKLVTNLEVTKEMPAQDIDTMNSAQLYKAFYELMVINAPAQLVEKYACKGEDGKDTYSKEYRFVQVDNIILHIHWQKSNYKNTDVVRAHIKKKADKYKIEKSTSLTINELKNLKVPIDEKERLFSK